jgi:CheY-like chemotaxis protein
MKGEPFNIEEVTKNACNYFTNILPAEVFTIEVSFAENIPAPIIGNQELVAQLLLFLINKAYLPTAPSNLHLSLSLHKATESQIFIRFTLNEKTVSKKRSHLYSIDELKDPPKHQKDPLLIHSNITNIVNLLNGEILTKDKEDEFDITIPFEIYSKSSNKWLENTEMTIGKLNFPFPILVVEDNHLNQKYLARLLQKWNLTFEIAENGLEGFEKAISTEYSIILMDLQMPVMDGFESAKKMRKSDVPYLKKIPIIALSASTLLTWTDQVIRSGMNDFLSKPFTPDQLFSTLNKYNSSIGEKSPNSIMDFEFTFNPVLDHHYLETIYQDDLEYAYEMFDIFVESIPVELQKLLQYMRKSNHEGVQKLAHKLKPTFAMVGLTEIKDLFQEIENATKNKDISYLSYLKKLENIDTQLDLIKKERDRLRSYLA